MAREKEDFKALEKSRKNKKSKEKPVAAKKVYARKNGKAANSSYHKDTPIRRQSRLIKTEKPRYAFMNLPELPPQRPPCVIELVMLEADGGENTVYWKDGMKVVDFEQVPFAPVTPEGGIGRKALYAYNNVRSVNVFPAQ